MRKTTGKVRRQSKHNCPHRLTPFTKGDHKTTPKMPHVRHYPTPSTSILFDIPAHDINGNIAIKFPRGQSMWRQLLLAITLFSMVSLTLCSIDADADSDVPLGDSPSSYDGNPSLQQWSFNRDKYTKLLTYIDKMSSKKCRNIPGISVSLVSEGRSFRTTGLGYADVERQSPASSSTLFCVASLTKAFTATLLARILHRKGLSWDTKVWDILGDKYPFMDDYVTRHVTIRDLLSHKTGIRRHDMLWISGISSRDAILKKIQCMKNEHGFRGSAIYNNILYALAGEVAEQLGGADWETLVTTELLEPLGMMDTTFFKYLHKEHYDAKATPYVNIGERTVPLGDALLGGTNDISPAIGVCTNALDMATWMEFQLSAGKSSNGYQVVAEAMMNEMHKGQVSTQNFMTPSFIEDGKTLLSLDEYGLGWFVGYYKGFRVLNHYGSYPGFFSMITLVPSMNFGFFTSINGGRQDSPYSINTLLHTHALDLAMSRGVTLSPNTSPEMTKCSPPEAPYRLTCERKYALPLRHLKKYTGTYYNAVFGNLTFTLEPTQDESLKLYDDVYDFIMSYNALRFLVVINDTLDVTKFCIETLDAEYNYTLTPNSIKFNRNIATDIIDSVNVPIFQENERFVKVPEGVRFEEWSYGECRSSDYTCNEIKPLPATARSNVSQAGFIIVITCLILNVILSPRRL